MTFNHWHGFCLAGSPETLPPGAQPAETPFAPLVFLTRRDPMRARGWFAITQLAQLWEGEDLSPLTPCRAALPQDLPSGLEDFVSRHGATVVNLAFARALRRLEDWRTPKAQDFRVALVGLGDVGRTVLAGLVLLGGRPAPGDRRLRPQRGPLRPVRDGV